MMGDCNRLCVNFFQDFVKPIVTEVSGRHLDAYLVLRSIPLCVEMFHPERNLHSLAKRTNECFVAIGLFSAQMKVAVEGSQTIMEFVKYEQQCNRVWTTAQCDQYMLTFFDSYFIGRCLNAECSFLLLRLGQVDASIALFSLLHRLTFVNQPMSLYEGRDL